MAQAAGTLDSAPVPADEKPFDLSVWLRLSVMMFLQFAIWGAWFVVLGRYLDKGLGLSTEIGTIYGTMAIGAIVSMMVAGQLVDRVLPSQYLMAIFHLIGAGLLVLLANVTGFTAVWWVALAYALVYNPTLTVSNALAFANIKDSTQFAWVRVFGTFGWIVAGLTVDFVLPAGSDVTNRPILLAAGLSAALAVFSLVLPHTPPSGKSGDALPFLRAFGLLRQPSFAIFFGCSLAITIALAFYYTYASNYLGDVKVERIATVMSIGQMSELGFMLLLPFAIRYLGMKLVLAVGMAAWVVRYGFFSAAADGTPFGLVLVGVALHGVCFDFFIAAGFIHTDRKAPAAIRGSAQALFGFLVYGVGMWIGNMAANVVGARYTTAVPDAAGKLVDVRDWHGIWMVPAIGAAVCLVLFLILWKDKAAEPEAVAAAGPVDPTGPLVREGAVAPGRGTEGVAPVG
jgi:nucleoside transporter